MQSAPHLKRGVQAAAGRRLDLLIYDVERVAAEAAALGIKAAAQRAQGHLLPAAEALGNKHIAVRHLGMTVDGCGFGAHLIQQGCITALLGSTAKQGSAPSQAVGPRASSSLAVPPPWR